MKLFFRLFLLFVCIQINAQNLRSDTVINLKEQVFNSELSFEEKFIFRNNRRSALLISLASFYTATLISLDQTWYADYPRSRFHFINDNGEWLQMDKLGHMASSYNIGVIGINSFKWAGFNTNQAIWYGGMTGSFFLTIIEILDGTSKQWGASPGDLIANTAGSFLAIGQALKWGEQRLQLKYSYHHTKWANINPEQLGNNDIERMLKDYNGQTYWLTFNIKSISNININNFPAWLSLGFGYSGEGMIKPYNYDSNDLYRQYFLSLDIDLNKIKTKNKTLNSILNLFGQLKIPAPTLEFSNRNITFHPIFY